MKSLSSIVIGNLVTLAICGAVVSDSIAESLPEEISPVGMYLNLSKTNLIWGERSDVILTIVNFSDETVFVDKDWQYFHFEIHPKSGEDIPQIIDEAGWNIPMMGIDSVEIGGTLVYMDEVVRIPPNGGVVFIRNDITKKYEEFPSVPRLAPGRYFLTIGVRDLPIYRESQITIRENLDHKYWVRNDITTPDTVKAQPNKVSFVILEDRKENPNKALEPTSLNAD